MARTSTVVWSTAVLVLTIVIALAAIYGPELVREGRAVVGPIVELARAEDRLAELDARMPFEPPADGVVPEDRFRVFLEVRRELLPHYERWQGFEQSLDRTGDEDWQAAKDALGEIQKLSSAQLSVLEAHRMPPAEFNWIEDVVYGTWAKAAAPSDEARAVAEAIRQTAREDLNLLAELEGRYGESAATRELRGRFDDRLERASSSGPPPVPGISDGNAHLFWNHRDEIHELDLKRYSELHDLLRGSEDVEMVIGEER